MILELDIILWIRLSKRKEKKKSTGTLRCLSHASNPLGFGVWHLQVPFDQEKASNQSGEWEKLATSLAFL